MTALLSRNPLGSARWFALAIVVCLSIAAPSAIAQGRGGPPACPDPTVAATADGNLLTIDHTLPAEERERFGAPGAASFKIYRADGAVEDSHLEGSVDSDGRFEFIAELNAQTEDEFLDEDVVEGQTYSYVVTYDDGVESEECPIIQATAIPFFGAPVVGFLAAIGAVGAYAWVGRRRKA